MHKQVESLRSVGAVGRVLSAACLFLALISTPAFAASNGGLPAVQLTQLPGSLDSPLDVVNAGDGSGRLFVVEQTGHIRLFKNGAFNATDFLDIHTVVNYDGGERGLLGAAFHPNYVNNGFFYVYYTDLSSPVYNLTIARYTVSADPDVADPASAQIVLQIPHPVNTNHNGGNLVFGPVDHYLYMGTGDGGGGGDVPNNAQNKNILLGKLLRIDVDGTGAVPCGQSTPMPYAIPPTNPFVGVAGCDEIWAYGVRNPWRFEFDRETADMIMADVGQELYEEVDFQPASSAGGENYGWHLMEGLHCYNPPTNCDDGSLTLPVLEETHANGWCAIVGGFRYRGAAIPGLTGVYLYGDLCLGEIWAATESAGIWTAQRLLDPSLTISSFGQDEAGELYVVDLGGAVYRIDPISNPTPTITNLSPDTVIAGDPGFTLDVFGTGFVNGSTVQWNGADRATTFVSSTHLTATITAGDIAAAGIVSIDVFNPLPGGGTSGAQSFYVNTNFLDVPINYFAAAYIDAIFNAGITVGCDVRLFCPERTTSRAEMAVFLLKAKFGSSHVPPDPVQIFPDVPNDAFAAAWIDELGTLQITAGCGGGLYCPDAPVSRAEMAVFLLKTSQGSDYVPPPATGTVFADVHIGDFAADWIEDIANRGVTGGCDAVPNYCPTRSVTRAEMAVFLTKMFGIPLP
jgi:glucose/arabinose dehydrogenase